MSNDLASMQGEIMAAWRRMKKAADAGRGVRFTAREVSLMSDVDGFVQIRFQHLEEDSDVEEESDLPE